MALSVFGYMVINAALRWGIFDQYIDGGKLVLSIGSSFLTLFRMVLKSKFAGVQRLIPG